MQTNDFERLKACAARRPPETAIVLGSGLGAGAERVTVHAECHFAHLPGLVAAGVPGHAGRLILGEWSARSILVFSGRLHFYEGHSWERVIAPVQLAAALGVRQLLLTNAAGGIRADLTPGTLMLVRNHLDWTRRWPWRSEAAGPSPYSRRLNRSLRDAAEKLGDELTEGAYAAVLGPNYETAAEIRALRSLGADAVGMSLARETEASAASGLECAAINCITNRAAGLSPHPLTHEEVLLHSQRQAHRLGNLLERFLASEL